MHFPWTKNKTATTKTAYETDFCQWAKEQTELARHRKTQHLELSNISTALHRLTMEIKTNLNEARVEQMAHMLMLGYRLAEAGCKDGRIWNITALRLKIKRITEESPSLKEDYDYGFSTSYQIAKYMVALNMGLDIAVFPETCPWTAEQFADINFLP